MSELSFSSTRSVLVSAFRYALGRRTYVVSDTVNALIEGQSFLEDWQKAQIVADISTAIATGTAGMDMDVAEWKRLAKAFTPADANLLIF